MLRRHQFLISAVLLASMMAAAGCTYNPATGRSQLLLMTEEEEIALGTEAQPELTAEYGGEVESAELREYVSWVGQRLAQQVEPQYTDLPWEVTVLDSDVINAFALPGGKVFVSRGLMSYMDNEAQLAAVLGHEIGHVTGQHIDERISHAMFVSGIAQGVGLIGGEGWVAEAIPLIVGVGGQGYLLKFGRDQESEADRLGLKYMTAAAYDPRGMLQLLQILIDASQSARTPEILSTHPDPHRRYDDVTALINREYSAAVDNPDFENHRDRFHQRAKPHLPAPSGRAAIDAGGIPALAAPPWCRHCAAGESKLTLISPEWPMNQDAPGH